MSQVYVSNHFGQTQLVSVNRFTNNCFVALSLSSVLAHDGAVVIGVITGSLL